MGDYHLKLLALLYLRPTEDFHLREVERLTGVPSGPANRELRRFQHAGLVTSRRAGNQVRYQADRSCIVFEELASLVRKTTGMADVIRDALQPCGKRIDLAFLFGSAASGKEGPYSDIDLLVVGTVAFDEVVQALAPSQDSLGRSINPVILKPKDFRAKREKGDAFLTRILAEPKIILIGDLDEPG